MENEGVKAFWVDWPQSFWYDLFIWAVFRQCLRNGRYNFLHPAIELKVIQACIFSHRERYESIMEMDSFYGILNQFLSYLMLSVRSKR